MITHFAEILLVNSIKISLFQHTSMKFRFFNLIIISILAFKHTTDFMCKINLHNVSQKHNFSYFKLQKYQFCQLTDSLEIRFKINISTSEITSIASINHYLQIHEHFHNMIIIAISFSKSNLQINKYFYDMIIIIINHSRDNISLKHH